METGFLGVPEVDVWLFVGLALAAFCTHFIGVVTGTAGGLLLLAILATFFPPVIVIPLHTVVQLLSNIGRVAMMWNLVVKELLLPFFVGALMGAALGARIFVTLPPGLLQGIIATFIIVAVWLPHIGKMGSTRNRFVAVGFAATFLGVFVSATGTLVAPFCAHASPDRRNYVATFGALMVITHAAKVAAFLFVGIAIGAYAPLIVAMVATGLAATWAGRKVLDRVPERMFRTVFRIILTGMALRLLWLAGREAGLV